MKTAILGPDDPAMGALEGSIRQAMPDKAYLEIVPWADYRQTLMDCLRAVSSPYQAVAVPGHVWLPELVDAGYFYDLDELGAGLETTILQAYNFGDIVSSVRIEGYYGDRWYQLPLFTDGHLVFYRRDLVDLPSQVRPSKWVDHIRSWKLPDGVWPLALKAHPSEIFLDWLPYLWDFGGELLDGGGRPIFNSPAGVVALKYYYNLRRFAPPETHEFGNDGIADALWQGRVAAAVSWGGQAATIFDSARSPQQVALKTANLDPAWNATWGVCLPANQTLEQARQALAILMALMGTECDREVTRLAGSPVRLSSYSKEEKQRFPWLQSQKKMLGACRTLPVRPEVGSFLGILYEYVYRAFMGEMKPKAALDEAAAKIGGRS
jgi:multiple sugar transport system substrate-binding protein